MKELDAKLIEAIRADSLNAALGARVRRLPDGEGVIRGGSRLLDDSHYYYIDFKERRLTIDARVLMNEIESGFIRVLSVRRERGDEEEGKENTTKEEATAKAQATRLGLEREGER